MSRNFDFSQAANTGITVLPDLTVMPNPSDLVVVKTIVGGVVDLGFASAAAAQGAAATIADTPPAGAAVSSLWWDSTGTGLYIRYNDGNSTQWVSTENQAAIGTVKIADLPPTAADNSLWWDSGGTGLYVRYNDGNSTQWVAAQNPYTLTDSPHDGNTYARQSGNWVNLTSPGAMPFLPLTGGTVSGPLNYTATGGTVARSAQDRAAEAVNVKDYGALGIDGSQNATAAFNAAIAAASATHKKVVWIPAGFYNLDPITIPEGVTLSGNIPGPVDPRQGFLTNAIGATLFVNSHATPFITLQRSACLQDVLIFDPGQVTPTAAAPNVFPEQILMADCSRVRGVTLCNAYDGIWVRSGRCYVEDCYIGAYHTCVDVDQVQDVIYFCNIWCGVFYDSCLGLFPWQNMDQWVMNNNGVAFKFGKADGVSMVNCGSFIKWASIFINDGVLPDGTTPGNSYGFCVSHNADNCTYGVVAYSTNSAGGWQFSNLAVLPNQDPRWQAVSPIVTQAGGAVAPIIYWTGGSNGIGSYWSNPRPLVNAGTVSVHNVLGVPDSAMTMGGQLTFANAQPLRFTDASGSSTTGIVLQNDNNLVVAGSGSTGAARNIAAMNQRSDSSAFNWLVPVVHSAATTFVAGTTFNASPVVANTIWSQWLDNAGSPIQFGVQSDNSMFWYGTNASGAPRLIMGMAQRSSTSVMGWQVPMQFVSTVGFNNTAPIAKPTVTGAKGANAALASLITALAAYGLVTDSTGA